MPRRPRAEEAGAIHHVFARGVAKRDIFRDDIDREYYLLLLEWVVQRTGWQLLAYCLMDNHTHLLVETPDPNLGLGMQRLHGEYARGYNDRHDLSGHVFQGRFESRRITSDPHLLVAARYVVRNPVEAQLCQKPGDWSWSSHGPTVTSTAPAWLAADRMIRYFAAFGGDGLARYAAFVSHPDSIEAPAPTDAEASGTAFVPVR